MRTLFRNGAVFDGHRYLGAGEVEIVDGRVEMVSLRQGSGQATGSTNKADEVVDLQGGLIAPGFIDAHVHAVQGGLERIRCDLSEHSTRAQYLAEIARYSAANPDRLWILGGGW